MSSETAITVRHLSKVFKLGRSGRTNSFARIIGGRLRHPIRGSGHRRELFRALDDVSFDVAPGEAVGVIGNNGAGKSTLLKILSRIMLPTEGYAEMAGTVGSLLEVGTGFHPELTGMENVYLNGAILGMTKRAIDARLDEIVDFAEVDQFLDTPVKRYSSGMRVRLAFAVAAHLEPEILIIDEVLSVGDYRFQAKCLDRMRFLSSDEGRTVLYVSHNLVTVENLCPRSLLLEGGRVVFDGPTAEALVGYVSMFPRAAAGSTPGEFDLASADRTVGAYPMELLKRLVLRPAAGEASSTVSMGQRLRIEIEVEGLDEVEAPNLHVGIMSSAGQTIFRLSSRMVPLEAGQSRAPNETIVIDIPTLPLTPGDYSIEIGVYELDSGVLLDEVHDAGEFTVIASDVLGNAYRFDGTRDGHVMVPFDWEIRPASGG